MTDEELLQRAAHLIGFLLDGNHLEQAVGEIWAEKARRWLSDLERQDEATVEGTTLLYNCFHCDRELEPVFQGETRQPFGAAMFNSRGNYGSTVWDAGGIVSIYEETLEIIICDECLVGNRKNVIKAKKLPKFVYEFEPWNPASS